MKKIWLFFNLLIGEKYIYFLKRKKHSRIFIYKNYFVFFFIRYHFKRYIYNYLFLKKYGLSVVPIVKYGFLEEGDFYIQKRIIDYQKLGENNYLALLKDILYLHHSSKISIKNLSNITTLRFLNFKRPKQLYTLGDFYIFFCEELEKRFSLYNNELLKFIKEQVYLNRNDFSDKYISFVHGDIYESNIFVKNDRLLYIDFENSGYFDYYYDFATFCLERNNFEKILQTYVENFSQIRLDINKKMVILLNNLYN